jgi:hypothetical protein
MEELTTVGMHEHFYLGSALLQKYPELLSKPYDPTKIWVQSTDVNRTIMSAISHLQGIFQGRGPNLTDFQQNIANPPYNNTEGIIANLSSNGSALPYSVFMPPIHIVPNNYQLAFMEPYDGEACPLVGPNQAAVANPIYETFLQYVQPTIDSLSQLYGQNLSVDDAQLVGDTILCDLFMNYTFPNITKWSQLYNDTIFIAFGTYFSYHEGTLAGTQMLAVPIFTQVLEFMENVVSGNSTLEFILMSGHDSTLIPMIAALGLATPECFVNNYINNITNDTMCQYPGFASSIIFELWNENASWYVNILYNDNPATSNNYGNYQYTLAEFEQLMNNAMGNNTLNDYWEWCGVDIPPSSAVEGNVKYGVYVMTGLTFSIFVALMLTISQRLKKKKHRDIENKSV